MPLSEPVADLRGLADAVVELQERILQVVYQPDAKKSLRAFTLREAARWIGLSGTRLRDVCAADGLLAEETRETSHRGGLMLRAEQIQAIREHLVRQPRGERFRVSRAKGEPPQIVASMIFKGGTGKTTLAVHLAQYLALRGYRVLLVDLDPQASATALFGINPAGEVEDEETLYGVVCEERTLPEIIRPTYWPGLDLVPANLSLALTDFEIAGRAKIHKRPIHAYLDDALATVKDGYDVVILDCRPDLGITTLNALIAATGVFVPVTMSQLDVASMGEFFRFSAFLLEQLPAVGVAERMLRFDFIKLVVNRYDAQQAAQVQCHHWLQARMPGWVVATPMVQTAALGHAASQWQTLYEYEPDAGRRRAYDRALEALDDLCVDLETVLWEAWGRRGKPARSQTAGASE